MSVFVVMPTNEKYSMDLPSNSSSVNDLILEISRTVDVPMERLRFDVAGEYTTYVLNFLVFIFYFECYVKNYYIGVPLFPDQLLADTNIEKNCTITCNVRVLGG